MKSLILLSVILAAFQTFAEMDKASKEALDKTKNLLTNPAERQEALAKDPKGKEVDQKVRALVGEEKKEDVYRIASEVFEKIAQETGGDPEKMKKILEEAQKNPEAFYQKMLSDSHKAKVRGIANDIEKKGAPSASPK